MSRLILGCGYLGSRVAELWQEAGYEVSALTRSELRLDELRTRGVRPYLGDVTDPESLTQLPDSETVLFAVAPGRVSDDLRWQVAVTGVANAVRELAPRTQRFLFISTTSVYGQNDGQWVDEDSPCQPQTSAGSRAVAAERAVAQGLATRGTDGCILRLSGIYGPDRLLRKVTALLDAEPIAAEPEGWLNLIHVSDAARAVLACESPSRAGRVYLVSDDRPITRRTYYERLAELVGAPAPRFSESSTEGRGSGTGKRCRNDRLRTELGLDLAYPTMDDGLPAAVHATQP